MSDGHIVRLLCPLLSEQSSKIAVVQLCEATGHRRGDREKTETAILTVAFRVVDV